jgi:hypothetical protein
MPDEMQDPRMAQMAMMRDRFMQNRAQQDQAAGQFQGGLSLPEQLPQGPVDPRLMMQRQNMMQRPAPPPMQLPPQAQGQPQGQPFRQPMGMPPAQGTPAQMPMANTMNPNAPSARPSMAGRQNMMRGQNRQMGARNQQMQQQAAQRSITPF